jgi:two-component system, cell cycle response regulator
VTLQRLADMMRLALPRLNEIDALALTRHHRRLARKLVFAGSALVLLIVPIYQLQELVQADGLPQFWAAHMAWRAVPFSVALIGLAWCFVRTDGYGAPMLLRLLALSVMTMIFGLFALHWMAQAGDLDRMLRGVIICTFAVTLFSLRGARELLLFFGLPFVSMLLVLRLLGQSPLAVILSLVDAVVMALIAVIAAEYLYRTWLDAFLANQRLAEHASTDPLTGLSNRRHIEPQLLGETTRALRHRATFSILMADLDHFKLVNDRYGHDVGDEVLREVARRIRSLLRTEDRPARWGGEEFLILLTDTDADQAAIVAEKLRQGIAEQPVEYKELQIPITISIGVAAHCGEREPIDLINRADQALYRAKHEGRNRVCVDTA